MTDPATNEPAAILSRSRSWVEKHSSLRKKRRTKQWNAASGRESVPPSESGATLPEKETRAVTRSRTQRMPPKPQRFYPGEVIKKPSKAAPAKRKSQDSAEGQPLSADAALLLEALKPDGRLSSARDDSDKLEISRDATDSLDAPSEAETSVVTEDRKPPIVQLWHLRL